MPRWTLTLECLGLEPFASELIESLNRVPSQTLTARLDLAMQYWSQLKPDTQERLRVALARAIERLSSYHDQMKVTD